MLFFAKIWFRHEDILGDSSFGSFVLEVNHHFPMPYNWESSENMKKKFRQLLTLFKIKFNLIFNTF